MDRHVQHRTRGWTIRLLAALAPIAFVLVPGAARAEMSLAAWIQHSPDDLTTGNIPGLLTLSGDNATASATMPFSVNIGGTNYSTIVISTNGWIEFGGNTQGTSDPTNASLPTSKHTNPFLAAYWDDLDTFGTDIRYGVVGTSPDRTYIVDWQVDVDPANEGNGADDMRFQVEIHESSRLITVHYDGTGHIANGQSATIGFQTAGGSGATAFPITFNGKVLDDNRNSEGWSIDLHKSGQEALAAMMASSPDDIGADTPAFTTLSGDNATAGVTLPFSVTLEGTSYNTITIGTNGLVQFGTTSGANPTANAALPSASFPNPTLFWFWDDLQTEGTNIRYGTVGTSPNRTFIIDFQENQVSSTGDKVNGQVQIHERSNLLNVKYRGTLNPNSNGQTATIGFQGAGGASAAAYPLTFNGKILDDDRPDEGWSVHALPTKEMSLHALHEYSPNDIGSFTSLTGDNATAGVTLPFSLLIDGVSYTNATIGTNGLVQFGTTSGANPTSNSALPSASFSGPTVFWYWDDLQPFSSNIQYGTSGTSPNRTFIIDFQEQRVGDTGNVVNGQVQIHERSNEINVQYRSTMSAGANGQNATIGFQGAGGAAAKAYPLTFNGKILDDNLPDAGWSVSALRSCGDGIVQSGSPFNEQCDQGTANGTPGSCCTASCTFVSAGTTCRSSAGTCDLAETCTGSSDTCPADAKSTTVCRSAAGVCDVAESCDGVNDACPADAFASPVTVCRSAAGVCDAPESCTGSGAACPADAKRTTVCRSSAGICDVDETCDGVSDTCPADGFQLPGVPCRGSVGICDPAEVCTGASPACPADTVAPSGTLCRSSTGECDPAEVCDGSSNTCPADGKTPAGTSCTSDGNPCTLDQCNGSSGSCQHPTGNAGAVCRSSTGECDPAETCTGASASCPTDAKSPGGTPCTSDGNVCTDDVCDGASALCQHPDNSAPCTDGVFCNGADTCSGGACTVHAGDPCAGGPQCDATCNEGAGNCFAPDGTTCSDGVFCNGADTCSGGACGTHAGDPCAGGTECQNACNEGASNCFNPPGTSCTDDGNVCTTDTCDGGGTCSHPAGNAGTVCRSAAGVCDVAESCTGVSTACPADSVAGAFVVCRASGGECDLTESCDGVGVDCPADGHQPGGTSCTDDGNPCTTDLCDGTNAACQHAAGNAGTSCRAAAGACDVAETCDGASPTCPADAVQPSGTVCRSAAGICDVAETCDGTTVDCPADALEPSTVTCRASAGQCDVAESCTGSSAACPADAFQPDGTACVDGDACTTDACQGGACVGTQEFGSCLDDFTCYKVKLTPGTPAFVPVNVTLQDTFETGTFIVKKVKHLCAPADAGSGTVDPVTHLESYQVKLPVGAPAHVRQTNLGIMNAIGPPLHIDTVKADLLLVPTNKDHLSSPPAPDDNTINVDHYKCYKAKVHPGTTKFPHGLQLQLSDQFTSPAKRYDVKAFKEFCTPVSTNGEPIKQSSRYLACYKVKPAVGQPLHTPVRVFVHNQFDAERLDTVKEDLICLPTERF